MFGRLTWDSFAIHDPFLATATFGMPIAVLALVAVLAYFKSAHPDWTLPSAGQILALGGGLIACHTITDVVHLVTDAIKVATEDGVVK